MPCEFRKLPSTRMKFSIIPPTNPSLVGGIIENLIPVDGNLRNSYR